MNKTVKSCLAAVAICGLLIFGAIGVDKPSGPKEQKTATAAVERMQRDTWLVDTPSSNGSAVHLQNSAGLPRLLTAAHVFRRTGTNGPIFVMQLRRGANGEYVTRYKVSARVLWIDARRDLALLEAATREGFGPGARLASRGAIVGERVQHVGFFRGEGIGLSYSEGVVSALGIKPDSDDWLWHIPLDLMILPAQAGSSGGAVFNDRGEVVGILVGGVNCALFVYVPVSQIVLQESSPAIVGKTP